MFYIHQTSCISPQKTYPDRDGRPEEGLLAGDKPKAAVNNQLKAVEPTYEGIPAGVLRRMSKSVKLGVGAAMPLLELSRDGILIGTGYGGMEDSVKFLKQIIEYDEGILTPGPFVQSTANAIASQIGLLQHNKGYNITYVHRGLSFESALIDAAMLIREQPDNCYLAGGVDEISGHNYAFELAEGWYKKEALTGQDLYRTDTPGSIVGEGAAMFRLNGQPANAIAAVKGIATLQSEDQDMVAANIQGFLDRHLPHGRRPDLLLSGENGDRRVLSYYTLCEQLMGADTTIARFKHLCGEYPTASAFALWLACNLPEAFPDHLIKRRGSSDRQTILIYNNYRFSQHSLILLERCL